MNQNTHTKQQHHRTLLLLILLSTSVQYARLTRLQSRSTDANKQNLVEKSNTNTSGSISGLNSYFGQISMPPLSFDVDKDQALNMNSIVNICPAEMKEDKFIDFYYQDEETLKQIADNSYTGLSQIDDNMAVRGWYLNPDPDVTFQQFIGWQLIERRGKWSTMTNPTYITSSYYFKIMGGVLQCPPGQFLMNFDVSSQIGNIIFIGLNCGTPDTTHKSQYDGECEKMDLSYENVCSDGMWMTGVEISGDAEQVICCKPKYTCYDSSCMDMNTHDLDKALKRLKQNKNFKV